LHLTDPRKTIFFFNNLNIKEFYRIFDLARFSTFNTEKFAIARDKEFNIQSFKVPALHKENTRFSALRTRRMTKPAFLRYGK